MRTDQQKNKDKLLIFGSSGTNNHIINLQENKSLLHILTEQAKSKLHNTSALCGIDNINWTAFATSSDSITCPFKN